MGDGRIMKIRSERGQTDALFGVIGFVVVVALLGVVVGLFTSFEKTPQDKICLSYGGGPFEGNQYQFTTEAGSGIFINGMFDNLYCYPQTERSFSIRTDDNNEDTPLNAVVAPSSDNIDMRFELIVYFQLNEDKIEEFHKAIGIKTHAYDDKEGESGDGWGKMLSEYALPQITTSIQRQARTFEAVEAYADPTVFRSIQANLASELPVAINDALGDDYFTDYRVTLTQITLPDGLLAELERNEASKIAIQTKQNEIKQRQAEAEAIAELNKALEASGPSYVYLKCIEDDTCQLPSFAPYVETLNLGQ
jgi:hypothetical protein